MTESTRTRLRDWLSVTSWPVASAGSALRRVVIVTDLLALVWACLAFAAIDNDGHAWASLALLITIAIVFEEVVHRAARLQIRLASHLRADMVSVWVIAGAIALDGGRAVLLLVAVFGFTWFRQQRPAGEEFYRSLFNAANGVLGCLVGDAVYTALTHTMQQQSPALRGFVPVLGAIAAAALTNRVPVTAAMLAFGMRGKQLAGSVHDNLIELATLCLGGLVAAAMLYEPWLAVLVIAPMVTLQRGALVRDLEAAAITDAKTGLLNAVAWEQLAQRELARAERVDGALAIMIIDIDRFKAVNDRYGHLVGDKVLAGVARMIKDSLREYDGSGRFGGEEFVAVMPAAGEHDALVIAERVRLRVNELTVAGIVGGGAEEIDTEVTEATTSRLSVSIGVAVLGARGTELADLLHAADQALYRAKWNGRNQVQLARRGDEIPEIVKV